MRTGKVVSFREINKIADKLSYCEIEIDFDKFKMFGDPTEIHSFIDNEVEYSIRYDVYEGERITVIANIVNIITVQTLDSKINPKLYPASDKSRAICNIRIRDMKPFDSDFGKIGFLSKYELGKSIKANWLDLQIIDAEGQAFNLRFFLSDATVSVDAVETVEALVGHYVKFNINGTKFGWQSEKIDLVDVPVVVPAEVETAMRTIQNRLAVDPELSAYTKSTGMLEKLKTTINFEMGYHLVEMASELYLLDAIYNISMHIDMKLFTRVVITSRGCKLPASAKFSDSVLNINRVLTSNLKEDRSLLMLLDTQSEVLKEEKEIYRLISNIVTRIMDKQRGINHEEDSTDFVNALHTAIKRLL